MIIDDKGRPLAGFGYVGGKGIGAKFGAASRPTVTAAAVNPDELAKQRPGMSVTAAKFAESHPTALPPVGTKPPPVVAATVYTPPPKGGRVMAVDPTVRDYKAPATKALVAPKPPPKTRPVVAVVPTTVHATPASLPQTETTSSGGGGGGGGGGYSPGEAYAPPDVGQTSLPMTAEQQPDGPIDRLFAWIRANPIKTAVAVLLPGPITIGLFLAARARRRRRGGASS